ncbi:hypothetical protein [Lyngbya sp. CCY1209]|uniref:hypothetical protein n=1 Tax=Lyngbya sp. CCY1209 TaxID=2886103 RepID=UPI002D20CE17|nr:hypothetical protein [Lyngbya sp. CCY1209]MEB3883024.1 hypothetical protein [Lyngbya sp. CCY1209]
MRRPNFRRQWRQNRLVILGMASLLVWGAIAGTAPTPGRAELFPESPQTRVAQQIPLRVRDVWKQVYERLPDLPEENNYVSADTGELAADNTLIDRLIRYHLYVQSRPPQFRFDWKLTLADYLGANELMREEQYPSATSLRDNPMQGDREAIRTLSREERNALVDVLVSIFNPEAARAQSDPEPPRSEPPPPDSSDDSDAPFPPLPEAGDAELLLP